MSEPSIKRNFFYSSILTTANYIFPMLTFPYVTRVLGPTNLGICNFVDSIIQYFLLISMSGIGVVGIREIAQNKNNSEKLSVAFSSLVVINLITTIIALLILFICVTFVSAFKEYKTLMWIGATKILFNSLLVEWFYKGIENFKYITNRTLIVKCLYVISIFLFVKEVEDYAIYYFLMTLMVVFNAIINLLHSKNFVRFSLKHLDFKPYISSMFIMGLYGILTSMYTTFNTMYLGFVAGETEVGYFSTAVKLYLILIALFGAFTGVMLPRMSSLLSEGCVDEFSKLLKRSISILFSFSVPLVVFSIINAKEIVSIIAGDQFDGAILPMKICMPLIIIIGYEQIIVIQGLMAMNKNKAVFINSIFGASVGILSCFLLMKPLKSVGAAIAWNLSEIVVLISSSIFIYKYIKLEFPIKLLLKNIFCYIPLAFFLIVLKKIEINYMCNILLSFLITILYLSFIHLYFIKDPLVINLFEKMKCKIIR